jgi:hypothetical protein
MVPVKILFKFPAISAGRLRIYREHWHDVIHLKRQNKK